MASWNELQHEHNKNVQSEPNWLDNNLYEQLVKISQRRKTDTVIFYASSFLQNPADDGSIAREDINGFMNALYNAPVSKGDVAPADKKLTLILHTPGGDPNAVESIVEYLHAKFSYIEVIVPYLAMSGGAMIGLASDLLVLGKQSQLGPIDPQLIRAGKMHSARAIQEGFGKARANIESDLKLAHLWAPILQNMGPSLFLEAEKALSYSKELVANWLAKRMFKDINHKEEREEKASVVAAYFNTEDTKYGKIHMHGQRIGREKIEDLGIKVESLEKDQELQNEVLTAYHLMTLIFETTNSVKFIINHKGKMWVKSKQRVLIPQIVSP